MKNAAKVRHAGPFMRFFILLLVVILSIGASGCMKKRDIPEELLQYMRDKYNEEFSRCLRKRPLLRLLIALRSC